MVDEALDQSDGGRPTEAVAVVDRSDLESLVAEATAAGVEATVVDTPGFVDPATAAVLLLGGSTAVGAVMYWLEQRKGGQVFDLRDGAPRQAYRTTDVAYGYVMILAVDGTVSVEVKEPRGAFGIVVDALRGAVVDLGKAALADARAAVESAVGDRGTVTTRSPTT